MILSDQEILDALERREIIIEPMPTDEQFSPSSLDLFLGDRIFEMRTTKELADEEPTGVVRPILISTPDIDVRSLITKYGRPVPKEEDGSVILQPNKFILGHTREYVSLPVQSKIAARVEGRSTLARLGLVIHMTAPTIHCGFNGDIVLEIYNFGEYPLRLIPGKQKVCQLIFERLGGTPKGGLTTRYLGQKGVTE